MIHRAHPRGWTSRGREDDLIERLLEKQLAYAICVRAEQVAELRREKESAPKRHPELRRHRESLANRVQVTRWCTAFQAPMPGLSTTVT